jgi:MFS family permease
MYFDWNFLFIINLPIALMVMVFAYNLLPTKAFVQRSDFDVPGVVFLGLFLAFFTLGINFLNSEQAFESLFSLSVWPFMLASFVFLFLLVKVELKASKPIIKMSYFSNRQILLVGFMAVGLGLFQSSFIFVPKMVVNLFDVKPFTASFMLIPVVFASAIGSPISGRLTDAFGSKYVIFWGLVAASTGMLIVAFISADKSLFYLSGSLIGLGFSMRTALNYIMLNEVGDGERATSQGLLTIFISLGQLSGAALIGAMIATEPNGMSGFRQAFLVLGIVSVLLAISSLWLKNKSNELTNQRDNEST